MSLSFYKLKTWWKMIRGKSIAHVNQGVGKCYSFSEIKGYYNDLTEKILKDKENYLSEKVLVTVENNNKGGHFPIEIFQYGLGSYDLMLQGIDAEHMHKKFLAQLEWCISNQNSDGSWNSFWYIFPETPFSSMAQGEGCSLLIRGYVDSGRKEYLTAAKKAIDFMLKPISEGGTAEYIDDDIIFFEFTNRPFVFNGWIFSIFGLIDYVIISKDNYYKKILDSAIDSFLKKIDLMDNGYWSMYRNDKTISSPFYHNLHIALLRVLFDYTRNDKFQIYYNKFEKYNSKKTNRWRAFIKKSMQKLFRG